MSDLVHESYGDTAQDGPDFHLCLFHGQRIVQEVQVMT